DERAVPAPVPAQPGQRDEHLARIRDHTGPARALKARVARPRRVAEQLGQLLAPGVQQDGSLVDVKRLAVASTRQRAPKRVRCRRIRPRGAWWPVRAGVGGSAETT